MAFYNGYYSQGYYPYSQMPQNAPQMPQNASAGQNNGIIWVQGENAAKSFPVGAGQSVLLMDSEKSVFYIKSTDQSGMPQPLRIFDYKEQSTPHSEAGISKQAADDYVSRKEFEEFREDVKRSIKGIRKPQTEESEGQG